MKKYVLKCIDKEDNIEYISDSFPFYSNKLYSKNMFDNKEDIESLIRKIKLTFALQSGKLFREDFHTLQFSIMTIGEIENEKIDLNEKSYQCKFNIAWVGKCNHNTLVGSDFCFNHSNKFCSKCGKQATRECDSTVGPLVCGRNLCDDCHCYH